MIVGDHGNCKQMVDHKNGQPHTAHTANPVPFHLIDDASRGVRLGSGGALEDVAPTLLALLGIEKPAEMTGRDLRNS
jgi:2,3-bisphosphoglycerate-independent phosphoglycerate mutase